MRPHASNFSSYVFPPPFADRLLQQYANIAATAAIFQDTQRGIAHPGAVAARRFPSRTKIGGTAGGGRPCRDFANCVNTGALILRSGFFAESFMREQLTMAIFPTTFLEHSPCSTRGFMADIPDWDQCAFPHKTEQCTLECLYRVQPDLFNATRCRVATKERNYLSGVLLEDHFQSLAYGGNTTGNTTELMRVFKDSVLMPKYEGSFVFNCMGGDPAVGPAKLICARQATLNYWPQLRDAVLGLGAE